MSTTTLFIQRSRSSFVSRSVGEGTNFIDELRLIRHEAEDRWRAQLCDRRRLRRYPRPPRAARSIQPQPLFELDTSKLLIAMG